MDWHAQLVRDVARNSQAAWEFAAGRVPALLMVGQRERDAAISVQALAQLAVH
jgi:hypothetical protein